MGVVVLHPRTPVKWLEACCASNVCNPNPSSALSLLFHRALRSSGISSGFVSQFGLYHWLCHSLITPPANPASAIFSVMRASNVPCSCSVNPPWFQPSPIHYAHWTLLVIPIGFILCCIVHQTSQPNLSGIALFKRYIFPCIRCTVFIELVVGYNQMRFQL